LDTTSPHFQNWVKAGVEFSYPDEGFAEWTVTPGSESCLTLVYLCYFDFFEAAQQFVENLSEPVPFETEIKLVLSPESWGMSPIERADDIEDGKLLHIAALMGRVSFVEYFISKGADINAISAKGISVLGSAVGVGWYSFRTPQCMLETVSLLLENGADPNLSGVSFTPLQRLMSTWSKKHDISVTVAISLLNFGADVNGLGDDESNIARLLLSIEDFRLQNDEDKWVDYDFERIITGRDTMWNYDSPLRIVDHHVEMKHKLRDGDLNRLAKMKELLISCGAKSLHHCPKGNLQTSTKKSISSL